MKTFVHAIAATVLLLPSLVPAQDLNSVLQDPKHPQKIKPADLPDNMRAVKIAFEKQGGSDLFSSLMNPMMMMMGAFGAMGASGASAESNPNDAIAFDFFDRMGISWTDGSTVELYGQNFLVTYGVQINMAEAMKSKNPPDLSKQDLVLTLVNTKSIVSITPRLDMTKEAWLKPAAPPTPDTSDLKSATQSNLKQLGLAMLMYSADYDDVLPYVQSTKGAYEVLWPYMKNASITKSHNPNSPEFRLNMAIAGVSDSEIPEPARAPLFYDAAPWPDGRRCVVFLDGHSDWVDEQEWQELSSFLTAKLPRSGKPLPATLGSKWPPAGGGG